MLGITVQADFSTTTRNETKAGSDEHVCTGKLLLLSQYTASVTALSTDLKDKCLRRCLIADYTSLVTGEHMHRTGPKACQTVAESKIEPKLT